ncbi:MAG: hypothetical protein BRC40_02795, partial [Cyanobacteria bacterium QH_8_48_120]
VGWNRFVIFSVNSTKARTGKFMVSNSLGSTTRKPDGKHGGQLSANAGETPSTLSVFQGHQETIGTVN